MNTQPSSSKELKEKLIELISEIQENAGIIIGENSILQQHRELIYDIIKNADKSILLLINTWDHYEV